METGAKPKRRIWTVYGVVALVLVAFLLMAAFLSGGGQLKAALRAQAGNEVNQLQTAALNYYTEYSVMPDATDNAGFIKELMADNPRKIEFLSLRPSQLNTKGEMVDPWGTPFHISMSTNAKVSVVSAGPDKIFGTADDIGSQNAGK